MIKVVLGALGLMASAGAVMSEGKGLSGDALRKLVSGRTIVVSTPVGGLPVTYRADGTLSGAANGLQVLAGAGPKHDTGRWWISANQVCQQWNVWLEARQFCYEMRVEGDKVHWKRSDGRTGTSEIKANDRVDRNATGR